MRQISSFLATLCLAACAAAPLPRLDPSVPATWQHTVGGAPAQADLKGWWTAFGDPELDARIEAALHGNAGLQQAAERLLAARTLRAHSQDAYLPFVRAHAGDEIAPAATASYIVSSFDASWEFGLFGRREATRRGLQGALDEAEAQFEGARVSLVAEVVADHLLLGATQERLMALEQNQALRARRAQLLTVRRELGLSSATDVDDGALELGKARAALAEARRQRDSAAQQLSALMGMPAPQPEWLEGRRLPDLQALPPRAAPADLLRTRPEIRRAEALVLQAAGERDLSRSDQWPNVGLVGSLQWSTSIARNHRPSSTNYIGAFGPLVDIPLFDWGLRRARTTARSHLLNAAVHAYRDSVLRGVSEAEDAFGSLQAANERVAQARSGLSLRERAVEAARRRSALGIGSELDALAPGLAVTEARLELVDARAAQGLAYVALYKALGGAALPADGGAH
ncbi:MAG: hypothetical protein RLZZ393_902 [Pseudomonadota bacterium]|jgi:NodT family efflux transporter outer membrane factor (OMF) lipoprotein